MDLTDYLVSAAKTAGALFVIFGLPPALLWLLRLIKGEIALWLHPKLSEPPPADFHRERVRRTAEYEHARRMIEYEEEIRAYARAGGATREHTIANCPNVSLWQSGSGVVLTNLASAERKPFELGQILLARMIARVTSQASGKAISAVPERAPRIRAPHRPWAFGLS